MICSTYRNGRGGSTVSMTRPSAATVITRNRHDGGHVVGVDELKKTTREGVLGEEEQSEREIALAKKRAYTEGRSVE